MKQYLRLLLSLRNRYLMTFDLVGLVIIPPLAMLLRTDDPGIVGPLSNALLVYTVVMIAAKMLVFVQSHLYSELWAYASVPALITMIRALALSALAEVGTLFRSAHALGPCAAGIPTIDTNHLFPLDRILDLGEPSGDQDTLYGVA